MSYVFGHECINQFSSFLRDFATGAHHYGSLWSETPYFMGELLPTHFRHPIIDEDCVKAVEGRKSQTPSRGLYGHNNVARVFKESPFVFQDRRAVVDTEKHFLRASMLLTHGTSPQLAVLPVGKGDG